MRQLERLVEGFGVSDLVEIVFFYDLKLGDFVSKILYDQRIESYKFYYKF